MPALPRVIATRALLAIACLAGALGCSSRSGSSGDAGAPTGAAPTAAPSGSATAASSSAAPKPTAGMREGNVVARSRTQSALYVADEDHHALYVVDLPFDPTRPAVTVALPGAPAQIVATEEGVLVTVRDPGLLVLLRPDAAAGLVEAFRMALPADAWGLALTPDGATAIVSSAWTHQVSAVDLAARKVRWSVDVGREPRGIVVRSDGASAYVTHLIGAGLTRLDDLAASAPRVHRVDLPASPLRSPPGRALAASLGYAATLSDDGARLFVARHALGALGKEAWFGASTVDVLLTADDTALAPPHGARLAFLRADHAKEGEDLRLPGGALAPFTQPRAVVYRHRTHTVLVAGEGDDRLVELDALALDPSLAVLQTYPVGGGYDPVLPVAATCAAPAGLALDADEATAFVFCRASYDLAEVRLDPLAADQASQPGQPGQPFVPAPPRTLRLAGDPVDAAVGQGRRLFYNATDRVTSGGLGCAGCHPEGRDDGFVWHEAKFNSADGTSVNFVGAAEQVPEEDHTKGYPRRTPMLAGRIGSAGPYGWHAESPTLPDRLAAGMGLHRWGAMPKHEPGNVAARSDALVAFLRKGLTPPPASAHPATPEEQRGHEIFVSGESKCARCHAPESEYTDRAAYELGKRVQPPDFEDEARREIKAPSLLFVAGHPPYFHDGTAATLEDLVERNADRMGHTSQLSKQDRAALVAFLRSL